MPFPDDAASLALILLAGGQGTRLGAGMPKALAPLGGAPLAVHALRRARAAFPKAPVVMVIPPGDRLLLEHLRAAGLAEGVVCVEGGAERADSVEAALVEVQAEQVLIHDAARALTPPEVFLSVAAALEAGASAVIPAVPVVDTIKEWDGATNTVLATLERSRLRAVQTPQGFRTQELKQAHDQRRADPHMPEATDDAMLMEVTGHEVQVVPGHEHALKVTAPIDLFIAEHYLAVQEPPSLKESPSQERRFAPDRSQQES